MLFRRMNLCTLEAVPVNADQSMIFVGKYILGALYGLSRMSAIRNKTAFASYKALTWFVSLFMDLTARHGHASALYARMTHVRQSRALSWYWSRDFTGICR